MNTLRKRWVTMHLCKKVLILCSLLVSSWAGNQACADALDRLKEVNVGGYSSARVQQNRHGKAEAALDEISLIFTWDNQDRVKFFAEIELENPLSWREGGAFRSNNSYLDVERLYLDYAFNDQVNLRAGRFLTPIGRWNLLHAAPLVWTTSRPVATSRLFPMALNGMMLHGSKPFDDAALEYSVFAETLKDQNEEANELRFRNARGARVVYSGLVDVGATVMEFDENDLIKREYRMLSLDFIKSYQGWELSGEAFFRKSKHYHEDTGGAYLQGVAPLGNKWFLIGRLESFKPTLEDSVERAVVGLAWRYKDNQIFKIEYAGGHQVDPYMPAGIMTSVAILF